MDGKCSDEKNFEINVASSCNLKIDDFHGASNLISSSGGNIDLSGSISDDSGRPISWTIDVAGKIYTGTGISPSATWDGKDGSGKAVDPGAYTATLTAQTVDGKCSGTKTISFTVQPPPDNSCSLYVDFGSSASVASGALVHSQEIFSIKGTGLATNMTLYYNSQDPHSASLGTGWSHSYDVSLKANNDGSMVLHEGNGKRKLYTLANGAYASQSGDYSTLVKNGESSFLLTQKDGTTYRFDTQPVTVEGDSSTVVPPAGDGGASQGGDTTRNAESYTRDEAPTRDGDRGGDPDPIPREEPPPIVPTPRYTEGKVVSIADRNGNTVSFTYSGNNLASVTDPSGRTVNLAYDAANHLTSITDPSGNVYAFTVAGDILASVTQPDGGVWRYTYDTNGFMLTKTDPLGNITTYTYDDQHRVVASTDPEGRSRSIVYLQTSETVKSTTFTEKDGGVWTYSYDTQKGTLASKADPQGGTTSYGYDSNGNRTSTTGPDGTTTTYTYDSAGNMLTSTDALEQVTNYSYNTFGQVTGINDSQGGTTTYAYDAKGNMTSLTDPTGATTNYGYDAKGNITKVINAAGQTTTFTYDAKGNLASVTDSAGAATSYTYDAAGKVISITDAKGAVTQFVYDARNRLIKTIDPQGNATLYSYDANGNKLSEADANGNTTRYEYNSRNQLIKTIDALGSATTYTYGGSACPSCGGGTDKLTAITDANGNVTSYLYDQLGRALKENDPLGNSTAYAYDTRNNPVSKTDANGDTINYSYDPNGRLLKKSYPDGTEESFTYDAKGNLLSAANKNISYTFSYDAAGRVLSSTDNSGKVISYEYDLLGNKIRMISPEGKSLTYTYDNANRQTSIINGGTFTFSYDSKGQRTSLAYPNGDTATYDYDNQGRLTSLVRKNFAGNIISSNSYTLDKIGNRQTNTTQDRTNSYSYDAIYRLTQALTSTPGFSANTKTTKGTNNAMEQQKDYFSYDPVGNRLTSANNRSYAYGPANQLVSENGTTYSYDKNGNLAQKATATETTTYTWDFENRLIKATTPSTTSEYAYDPFGRRIEKKVTESGASTTTEYFYDNQAILFDYDENGVIGNRYIHGPNMDEPLAITTGKDKYYYHADGLGSIIALTDQSGKVVQTYEYDSFGNLKDQKNRVKQSFTYTGREWDRETGLYYYRARYYDPIKGRFISKDPISFAGGDVVLYGYVLNNPINRIDPSGLDWFRPKNDPYVVGRENSGLVEPGKGIGAFIDDYIPAGHTFGTIHDEVVDTLHHGGLPDLMINIPTMPIMYFLAIVAELDNSVNKLKGKKPQSVCH